MAEDFSNQLPANLWNLLQPVPTRRTFAPHKILFQPGQTAKGVYLLESGSVDLFFSSSPRHRELFATVGASTILGLSETISGGRYKLIAQAAERTQASFVSRSELLKFLRQNQVFCLQIVLLLSEDLHQIYFKIRNDSRAPAQLTSAQTAGLHLAARDLAVESTHTLAKKQKRG